MEHRGDAEAIWISQSRQLERDGATHASVLRGSGEQGAHTSTCDTCRFGHTRAWELLDRSLRSEEVALESAAAVREVARILRAAAKPRASAGNGR